MNFDIESLKGFILANPQAREGDLHLAPAAVAWLSIDYLSVPSPISHVCDTPPPSPLVRLPSQSPPPLLAPVVPIQAAYVCPEAPPIHFLAPQCAGASVSFRVPVGPRAVPNSSKHTPVFP